MFSSETFGIELRNLWSQHFAGHKAFAWDGIYSQMLKFNVQMERLLETADEDDGHVRAARADSGSSTKLNAVGSGDRCTIHPKNHIVGDIP